MFDFDRNKILGSGGFGTVYQGRWTPGLWPFSTLKPVAVKRIQLRDIQQGRQQGEETLRDIDHPNIVKLFHVEDDKDFRHFVLELCVASLDKLFLPFGDPKKYMGPPMPSECEVLLQLASGLGYIHSKFLVHRDIKPENVLIHVNASDDKVTMKWADFGLSRTVNERGTYKISKLGGTRDWLAPELLEQLDQLPTHPNNGDQPSRDIRGTVKSDVFAEGLLFAYYLSDGVHPHGKSSREIATNLRAGNPTYWKNSKPKYILYSPLLFKMIVNIPEERIPSLLVVDELGNIQKRTQRLLTLCEESNPNLKEISSLIQEGVDINYVNEKGQTPFLLLIKNQKCKEEEDIRLANLQTAANNDSPSELFFETIKKFIQNGVFMNYKNKDGDNSFTLLCWKYNQENLFDIARLLIQNGIDVNCKENKGWNALHSLCRYYDKENLIDIVRLLIETGIDVNCKENEGWNAANLLCGIYKKENLFDIVRLLIENGVDVNCRQKDGWNALHFLCRYYTKENLFDTARLLIENGINVNCKQNDGWNALHLLCRYYEKENLVDIVCLFIENGIDLNCKTRKGIEDDGMKYGGFNVLHFLCWKHPKENLLSLVQLLVQYGIDKNIRTTGDIVGNARSLLLDRYPEHEVQDIVHLLVSLE